MIEREAMIDAICEIQVEEMPLDELESFFYDHQYGLLSDLDDKALQQLYDELEG